MLWDVKHAILENFYVLNSSCMSFLFDARVRGHVQTIIGKINVIVMLGGRGVQGVTLRIAAEGKTVSKQGKFVSNHDVKSGGGVWA